MTRWQKRVGGTVAAAMEGVFLKIPSVAMSVATEENVDFENG